MISPQRGQRARAAGVFHGVRVGGRAQLLLRGFDLLLQVDHLRQGRVALGQGGVKLLLRRAGGNLGIDHQRGDLGLEAESERLEAGLLGLREWHGRPFRW